MTLLHLFILSILLYFGAYTAVDVALIGVADLDWLVSWGLVTMLTISVLVLWSFSRFQFPALATLRTSWHECPPAPVAILVGACFLYRVYTAVFFGQYGSLNEDDLRLLDLPYWYTAIGMLVNAAVFPAAFCAWGKFSISRGLSRLGWLVLLMASTVMILGVGRRAFVALLIVILWDLLSGRRLGFRHVFIIALSFPALVIASNLFQTYREVSVFGAPVAQMEGSVLDNAIAFERTVTNLETRSAMWRFNYDLMRQHVNDHGSVQWGAIFLRAVPNYVPSFFGKKSFFNAEEAVLQEFHLDKFDRPSNLWTFTYADFGWGSAFVAPAFILAFAYLIGRAVEVLRDPFLRMLLMGMAVAYALNLETDYLTPLSIARDFLLLAVAYIAGKGMWRLLVFGIRPQHQ